MLLKIKLLNAFITLSNGLTIMLIFLILYKAEIILHAFINRLVFLNLL